MTLVNTSLAVTAIGLCLLTAIAGCNAAVPAAPVASAAAPATSPAATTAAAPAPPQYSYADWEKMRPIRPRGYVCYRAGGPVVIDGRGDEAAWAAAPWTEPFVDIEGDRKPAPRFKTRAKLLWDDQYLYVYAELEEPHVWGTLTEKNSIIFHDPDLEVFIDPDGDNHHYYEFEMNALNTIWELTLDKPYRDGGPAHHGANLDGLHSAVHVRGTLNNPSDTDQGWSVEIAFPWAGLKTYAGGTACPPHDGDRWRINFSRVEWLIDIIDGRYRKVPKEAHPEDNWVWSPQGVVDMHRPERWGYVQFSTAAAGTAAPGTAAFQPDPTLAARDLLMGVYYRQRDFRQRSGRYAGSAAELGLNNEGVSIAPSSGGYVATVQTRLDAGTMRTLHVNQDSKIWSDGR